MLNRLSMAQALRVISNHRQRAPINRALVVGCYAIVGFTSVGAGLGSIAQVAQAETSSWRQRVPAAAPPAQPSTKVGGPKLRQSLPATRGLPTPSRLQPQAPPLSARAPDGQGLLRPPERLRRRLGPLSSVPSGENAAFIAYEQGLYLTAYRLAQKQAQAGDAAAHTLIGRLHGEGLGIARDPVKAAEWYAKADQLGNVDGTFSLGLLFATGDGVAKDPDKAAALFEKAARARHAYANYNLALAFLSGRGKPENPQRAALHLKYAASKDIAQAQYDLATLYDTGHGVTADAYKAASWLRKAANNGMTVAQYEYAVKLLQGQGLNADRPRIVEYLKGAALKGVPGAQNRLAHLYFEGGVLAADPVAGARWRLIARSNGFSDPVLDKRVAKLPRATRRTAQEQAEQFLATAAVGATPTSPQ